jgi:hypothetical protein
MESIVYLWQQVSPVELDGQAQCLQQVCIAAGRPHTIHVLPVCIHAPHLVSYEGRGVQQLLQPIDGATSTAVGADTQSNTQQQHRAAYGIKSGC